MEQITIRLKKQPGAPEEEIRVESGSAIEDIILENRQSPHGDSF